MLLHNRFFDIKPDYQVITKVQVGDPILLASIAIVHILLRFSIPPRYVCYPASTDCK